MIKLKRIYQPAESEDGVRILVDCLWPRGIRKDSAAINLWLKDVAPSTELRKWFDHDPEKWGAFKAKYFAEFTAHLPVLTPILSALAQGNVTLVYSSREPDFNQAVALKDYLASLPSAAK